MALTNSQFEEIMREYNQLKFQHVREQESRTQEIYQKMDEGKLFIETLDGKKRSALFDAIEVMDTFLLVEED